MLHAGQSRVCVSYGCNFLFLRQIDMSDVTEVSGVMEAAGMLQLDPITTFCAERLLKKDDPVIGVQAANEGHLTDVTQREDIKTDDDAIVESNDSALDETEAENRQENCDSTKEVHYQRIKATPSEENGASNTGCDEERKAAKHHVETSEWHGKYREYFILTGNT